MHKRICLVLVSVLMLLLATAGAAQASVTVSNQNDSGPGSLRQTVAEAPPGETVVLPAGTYTLASTLKIEKSLTIAGHAAGDTIIRAGGAFGVIENVKKGDLELSDVTIRDGLTSSPAYGAGIFCPQGNLSLHRVVVTNNVAASSGSTAIGAGVLVISGQLEVIESQITKNTARSVGASGAAGSTAIAGGVYAGGTARIVDSTISGNVAESKGGQGPSNPAQDGGTADAGGLYLTSTLPGTTKVLGSTISGNVAETVAGPGGTGGTAVGGGISVTSLSPVTIANSTIALNASRSADATGTVVGGGGYLVSAEPEILLVLGATVSNNSVGGGSTTFGGDLYATQVAFRNTIVANGSGPAGSENCFSAVNTSLGFNIDSRNQCEFKTAGDKVNADPQLGPLQSNGGPTQTMLPAGTSPAIDQGTATRPFDQRGVGRPIDFPSIANAPGGDGSDIGAVELQPSNAISLGKVKLDKKKGTATVPVAIPTPSVGTLTLTGAGLKPQTLAIAGQGSATLKIAATGGAAKSLRKKGKRKVTFTVTYTPTANAAATQSATTQLRIKKKKKHHRKH